MKRPPARRYGASKEAGKGLANPKGAAAKESRLRYLERIVKRRTEVVHTLTKQLEAYQLRYWNSLGGGIDCSQFDLVIICRKCGSLASPTDHVCSGR